MELLDFKDYLISQSQERYRTFIIYAPPISRKTWFAERVKERFGNKYGVMVIDLQTEFASNPDLGSRIDSFSPSELKMYLLAQSCEERVIIIDNPDLLLNTWNDEEKAQFVRIVEDGIKSEETEKILIFIIQTDPGITQKKIKNTKGHPRILPLDAFADF